MWYYDKEYIAQKTPSRMAGIDLATELQFRREGARFIIDAGTRMGLRFDTMATGVVFFHRFYMCQSFAKFDRWVVAAACLLLAGKVEETPKKCRDIFKTAKSLLLDEQVAGFRGDEWKEQLLVHERILLQTIKFDLQVSHPYGFVFKFAKAFKGDKSKVQKVVQMAWTFINDSLCTTISLQFLPHVVAIAMLNLASKLSKVELVIAPEHLDPLLSFKAPWWDHFLDDASEELLAEVAQEVLDLYSDAERDTPGKTSKSQSAAGTPKAVSPKAKLSEQNIERITPPLPPPATLPPQATQSAPPQAIIQPQQQIGAQVLLQPQPQPQPQSQNLVPPSLPGGIPPPPILQQLFAGIASLEQQLKNPGLSASVQQQLQQHLQAHHQQLQQLFQSMPQLLQGPPPVPSGGGWMPSANSMNSVGQPVPQTAVVHAPQPLVAQTQYRGSWMR